MTGPIANLPYVDLPACLFTQLLITVTRCYLEWDSFKSRRTHSRKFYERARLGNLACRQNSFYSYLSGLKQMGIELDFPTGQLIQQCGFQIFDRMEGLYPEGPKEDTILSNQPMKNI